MSSILKNLADELHGRKLKAIAAYKTLVGLVAGEKKLPSTADIEATLTGSGKSIADLESDVAASKRRSFLRAQIAMADELLKERPAIDAQIEKAKAALMKAQEVHDAAVAPLRQRVQAINDAQHSASLAASELQRAMPDEFDGRSAECERNVRQSDSEFRASQKHLSEVESRLNSAQLEVPPDDEQLALYRSQVANAKVRLKACQEASSDAVNAQDELLREMQAA